MEKWEYKTLKYETKGLFGGKVVEGELEEQFNRLGAQGWELVTSFDTSIYQGQSRDIIAIFKRKVL